MRKTATRNAVAKKSAAPVPNVWKLQDAKAQFSEVVRRARAGDPQQVTVHGKEAVVVVDAERFEVRPKSAPVRTMADFVEGSKKYRGAAEGIEFGRPFRVKFRDPRRLFEDEAK